MSKSMSKSMSIDGLSPDELLALSDEDFDALILLNQAIAFRAGSAEILGQFRITKGRLVIELAHIDGGGEGVLPTLWVLGKRVVQSRGLEGAEWIVHAVSCARPNLKLQRVLERRGFQVRELPGLGEAYTLFVPAQD